MAFRIVTVILGLFFLINFIDQVEAVIAYPANVGWFPAPFGPAGSSTLIVTNFQSCEGTISLLIPLCSNLTLSIKTVDGVFIGETPILNSTVPCLSYNFTEPPTEILEWETITYSVPKSGAVVFNITTVECTESVPVTEIGLRFDVDPNCESSPCSAGSPYNMLYKTKVSWDEASTFCKNNGMNLAAVTGQNFINTASTLFFCGGSFVNAWVNTWEGNNYSNNPKVLATGVGFGGGAIVAPRESTNWVMCQIPVDITALLI